MTPGEKFLENLYDSRRDPLDADRSIFLPIKLQDDYTPFFYAALPLFAVLADDRTDGWFKSRYIQLKSLRQFDQTPGILLDCEDTFAHCEIMHVETIEYAACRSIDSLSALITAALALGYYTIAFVDNKHLDRDSMFNIHEFLIYGHDVHARRLQVVGFNKRKMFSRLSFDAISFDEAFTLALDTMVEGKLGDWIRQPVRFVKMKDSVPGYSPEFFLNSLERYASEEPPRPPSTSVNGPGRWWSAPKADPDINPAFEARTGFGVYAHLIDHLEAYETNPLEKLDYRVFHALADHKRMMMARLSHFNEVVANKDELRKLIHSYKAVIRKSNSTRLSVLSHVGFGKRSRRTQWIESMHTIRNQERTILLEILAILGRI